MEGGGVLPFFVYSRIVYFGSLKEICSAEAERELRPSAAHIKQVARQRGKNSFFEKANKINR